MPQARREKLERRRRADCANPIQPTANVYYGPKADIEVSFITRYSAHWELKMRTAWLCAPLLMTAGCATVAPTLDKASVLSVDDRQRAMVATADLAGLEKLAHPDLRINAPGGRVLTREQFLKNMRSGEIAAEAFQRTVEDVKISGNVAVIMGRETFTPTASSELGRNFGAKPLQRRYTNIYLWEQGRWFWLARHANVLPSANP